ncbi:MAG: sulfite exporter TauE/SafE family protein [Pseudomonadota bacterium]|nr:sulfite exporter TauE/SafE family protein [Pseudomonadota bacterium]
MFSFLTVDYSWIALVVLIGACLQGAGGIGFGMFVGPVFAIGRPDLVPGPVLLLAGLLSTMSAVREYRSIDFRVLGYSLAGRIPASVAGGMLFALLPLRTMSIVFALLILGAVGLSLKGWRVHARPQNFVLAGAVSGFMGTITSVGAPPMAIVYQDFGPPKLRATIGAFFVAGAIGSLAVLAAVGRFGAVELKLGLSLVVPMAIGFALSNVVVRHLDRARTRLALLVMSGVAALALLLLQLR